MPAKTKKDPKEKGKIVDDEEFEKALKDNAPRDKCFSQKPPKSK